MTASIYDLFVKRPAPTPDATPFAPRIGVDGGTAYARRALESEAERVATTREGGRNDALNLAAFNMSQLVTAGHIDAQTVWDALHHAATRAGLPELEIERTLRSGYDGAKVKPRTNVPDPDDTTWLPPVTIITPAPPKGGAEDGAEPEVAASPEQALEEAVYTNLPLIDWHQLWADDEEQEWILEPLLPARRLVALYSPPKVGKSLLMLELAVAISQGAPTLGTTIPEPHRVLYVDYENDPKGDIRSRLQAMGHTPDTLTNLCYLSFPSMGHLDTERGSLELIAAIDVYRCSVVVIDTVSRSIAGEENENDTWLNFYRHTGLKLKQRGIAMIRLDHTGKNEHGGQRGGSAKSGDVDAVWRMSKVTDDTFKLECEANRLPIAEKEITLTRKPLPHLHHKVEGDARAAAWEAKLGEVSRALDHLGLPADAGRTRARELLKTTGVTASNAAVEEVLRRRKVAVMTLPQPMAGGDQ